MDGPRTWYPGHMAKARRKIADLLKKIDVVIEVVDARAPLTTRNPVFNNIVGKKPTLILAAKADLAQKEASDRWSGYFKTQNETAIFLNLQDKNCKKTLLTNLHRSIEDSRFIKTAVVGIPNVGKSTLINLLAGKKVAPIGAKPGITRNEQWYNISANIRLSDTPGVMMKKITSSEMGWKLAWLDCLGSKAYDVEEAAEKLLHYLIKKNIESIADRYGITCVQNSSLLLDKARKKRGMLLSGGRIDYTRTAQAVLKDFRQGKLGKITLELP